MSRMKLLSLGIVIISTVLIQVPAYGQIFRDTPEALFFSGDMLAVALSPDGNTLASCDYGGEAIHLWDIPSQEQITVLWESDGNWKEIASSLALSLAFKPDGRLLIAKSSIAEDLFGPATIELWASQVIPQQWDAESGITDSTYSIDNY